MKFASGGSVVVIWTPVRPNFSMLGSAHQWYYSTAVMYCQNLTSLGGGNIFSVPRIDLEAGATINASLGCETIPN